MKFQVQGISSMPSCYIEIYYSKNNIIQIEILVNFFNFNLIF
jgi:hypothetical protein